MTRLFTLVVIVVVPSAGCNVAGRPETPAEQSFIKSYTDIECGNLACCATLGQPHATEFECRRQASTQIASQRAIGPSFSPARASICLVELAQEFQACVFPLFGAVEACLGVWNVGRPLGAPCDLISDCAAPGENLVDCELGSCSEIVPAADGELCDLEPNSSYHWRQCDKTAGITCNGVTGHCQRAGVVGETCGDVPCDGSTYCSGSPSGICAERSAEGEPCTFVLGSCADGLYCTPTGCQRKVEAGGGCSGGETCVDDAECQSGVCIGIRLPGQACDASTDHCQLGSCTNGHCTLDTALCE